MFPSYAALVGGVTLAPQHHRQGAAGLFGGHVEASSSCAASLKAGLLSGCQKQSFRTSQLQTAADQVLVVSGAEPSAARPWSSGTSSGRVQEADPV